MVKGMLTKMKPEISMSNQSFTSLMCDDYAKYCLKKSLKCALPMPGRLGNKLSGKKVAKKKDCYFLLFTYLYAFPFLKIPQIFIIFIVKNVKSFSTGERQSLEKIFK